MHFALCATGLLKILKTASTKMRPQALMAYVGILTDNFEGIKMKKLIAAVIAATFAMGTAFAQAPATAPEAAVAAPAHKKAVHKKTAHKKSAKKAVKKAAPAA
ncbi:hypothetical protein [Pseudoduganella sp. LjRoot289]|uniref:hypothetical protein n=1 Tax=Pseudoduganella sp. LjRoot289 TaxID=3342314 RepID=UPI003F5096C6